MSPDTLLSVAVAAGSGMLIVIDRERRKGSGPARAFAGLRTFTLASVLGALSQVLAGPLVPIAGALVAALAAIGYWRDRSDDPGITTELALFLSFVLGVAAVDHAAFCAGAAVVTAMLLNLRGPLHRFVRVSLTRTELRDGLVFAGAALVVRPLLPDTAHPWLLGVNPRTLWTLAILVMGVQAAAHIGLRLVGARLGFALSGLAAGFISGVATITAMGARCRGNPELRAACVAGALASNVSTFALLWVVALTVAPGHQRELAPLLASALAAALAVAAVSLVLQKGSPSAPSASGRVFDIKQAVLFALALSGGTTILAYLTAHAGEGALVGGTGIAGFFDLHAAAGSALSLLASGAASPRDAMLAVLLAITANMISKGAGALAGGMPYALRVNGSLSLVLLAAWLPFWLLAA